MRWNFLKSPICLIAAPVILVVCILELTHVQAFQLVEWLTYDWRVRLAHNYHIRSTSDATNLGVVEISDNTIAAVNSGQFGYQYGLYWPRQVYADALNELTRQGAKAVAFDVLFAEQRPDHPPVTLSNESISGDEFFARQLAASSNAILAADHGLLPDPIFKTNAWRIGSISAEADADGVLRRDRAFGYYREWHPLIKQIAAHYNLDLTQTAEDPGKITFYHKDVTQPPMGFTTDAQGSITVPNVPPFHPYQQVRVWSMGIVLAARQLNLDLTHPEIDLAHHRIVLHGEHGLSRTIPVDAGGYFYIDWSTALNDRDLASGSLDELLAAQVQRSAGVPITSRWRDKLVVIGSTATGNDLTDLGSTALESHTFYFSKHWNVANSVISGRFVHPTPTAGTVLLIILVGALSAWITWVVPRPVTGTFLMAATALVYLAVAVVFFIQWRLWVPIVLPLVCAGFVTHLSALTYRVTVEQSERKRVKSLFSRLVSPEVVNQVLGAKAITLDSLAGKRRHITVSFADIRGFTELTDAAQSEGTEFVTKHALSQSLAEEYFDTQAKEVMKTVSLYLGTIADCVKQHNGTLDKYIGDCVMAFWGAPLDNPQHALAAVRCAIEAQRALAAVNAQREEENRRRERENFERLTTGEPMLSTLPVLSMGTGINTGMAIAGFMGSDAHIVNYTVFGREVNLASRLEGISGHGRIIIGEGTYVALQRDDPALAQTCVELPRQPVKGFRERVRMFEVPWKQAAPAQPDPSRVSATAAT